jgi:long-subunit acyl-CoA synthetase (AMP-forming)
MHRDKTLLDYVYAHEAGRSEQVVLIQPVGAGQVIEYTWAQMMGEARRMAAHLLARGFPPGARIATLSKNSAHCFMAELAIWMSGGTTVALFPTESAENIRYVLEHSEASLVFVGKLDGWERQSSGIPATVPCLAFPSAPCAEFQRWDEIVGRTPPLSGCPARDPGDLGMLLYTSGSTGQPKGVMHTFEGITRVSEHLAADQHLWLPEDVEWRVLSYLPLSHVYERATIECRLLCAGRGRVFFSESVDTFVEDIKRARPTMFCSVPRLWLKLQQAILKFLPQERLDELLRDPARAPAAGREILAAIGLDQTVAAISGSAPLPDALLEWWRRLGLNLLEGYAMTEDFCYSHASTSDRRATGYVGAPRKNVEARIGERGEILIKSPGRFAGYYQRPDLDAESFTEDGFFRTGDVGEQRADGLLRITGRLKELFKTAKGKYVAPAPIENRLNAHPMVELSMVSGVGAPAPFAALVLAESLASRIDEPAFRAEAHAALAALLRAVNAELAAHERLRMLVVLRERWSIDNGCLTPTLKIKRGRIETMLAPELNTWYAAPDEVLWASSPRVQTFESGNDALRRVM